MTYDKEFEEIYKTAKPQEEGVFSMHDVAFTVWQAARKDHYRIGEEVESFDGTQNAKICAVVEYIRLNDLGADNVRRIPAKSRIDEIAEDVVSKQIFVDGVAQLPYHSLEELIKSAIMKDREGREAER